MQKQKILKNKYIVNIKNLVKNYYVSENKGFKTYFFSLIKKRTLTKIEAIKGISFKVKKNESIALIGRNGAGKSTLVKLLTGILKKSSGEIKVFDKDPFKNRIKNNFKIGVVFGQRTQLRWDISPYESYKLLKNIYCIDNNTFKNNLERFINILELEKIMYQPVRSLSLGQKMRCEFVAAFLHNPELVFLDEPTIGLDIFSKTSILNFLKNIRKERDITIFLTTHDLYDIEEVTERAIIIEKGQIFYDGQTSQIKKIVKIRVNLKITIENKKLNLDEKYLKLLSSKKRFTYFFENIDNSIIPELLNDLFKNNKVVEIKLDEPDFKDVIKEFYKIKELI